MTKEELIYLMYEIWVTHAQMKLGLWVSDDIYDKYFHTGKSSGEMFRIRRLHVLNAIEQSGFQYRYGRIYYVNKGYEYGCQDPESVGWYELDD
jgi:hypothetical protein